MKKNILLLSLLLFHLFVYSQGTKIVSNYRQDETRPAFLLCLPNVAVNDYSENIRNSIHPFNFIKLHFETQFDFYLKVTIDIDASGKVIVNIQDDYFAQTTTISSTMYRNDFANLLLILARCDFDNFREESVVDNLNCCNSFFEVSFNDEVITARNSTFYPFNNRELQLTLWRKMNTCYFYDRITPRIEY
ncbi:MAG: hypothetical protein LBI45_06525 [Bacteroidales bacterium]|jgi:hypothetical protein|nr:hypothetical protein [Bacteroidales bacterium]